jgi:hypothetical protein
LPKSVSIEIALTAQVRLLSSWNISGVFLSEKWFQKAIGKKLRLSIFVSIKNFPDRLFAILIGIGIAITIFFWYQDFLSSSVSLSRPRKAVVDDKPAVHTPNNL